MNFKFFQGLGLGTESQIVDSAMQAHVEKVASVSTDELVKRLDYKTKIAVDELLSFSSFTKRVLLYLIAITSLSAYLTIVKVHSSKRRK